MPKLEQQQDLDDGNVKKVRTSAHSGMCTPLWLPLKHLHTLAYSEQPTCTQSVYAYVVTSHKMFIYFTVNFTIESEGKVLNTITRSHSSIPWRHRSQGTVNHSSCFRMIHSPPGVHRECHPFTFFFRRKLLSLVDIVELAPW